MKFPKDMVITKITHISVANFKKDDRAKMNIRPWYGIAFSLGGEMTYIDKSKKIRLFGNRVVFIPKNSTYDYLCDSSGSFAIINFLCNKEVDVNEFLVNEATNMVDLKNKFQSLHNLFLSSSNEKRYNIFSELYKFFSLLTSDATNTHLPKALVDAIGYIEKNLSSTFLCNTQIAEYAGISEVYLRKLFTEKLSISVGQYIKSKRIEKAEGLLTQTTMTVTQISEECGYSCIYYFCRCFKQKTGYTPKNYRLNNSIKLF